MRTTIDAAGRIVIPKKLREKAGLTAGTEVEVQLSNGRVEIEPVGPEARLEWRNGFLVAVPQVDVPPMTSEQVAEMIDYMRVGRLLEKLGDAEQ